MNNILSARSKLLSHVNKREWHTSTELEILFLLLVLNRKRVEQV